MHSYKPLHTVSLALLLAAWTQATPAAWQTLGHVEHVQRGADAVELSLSSGAHLRVTFVDKDVVRVRMSARGSFERDFSYALEAAPASGLPLDMQIREEGNRIVLHAGAEGGRVEITQAPELLLDVYDATGNLVVADDRA